jgi:hypothetical protein
MKVPFMADVRGKCASQDANVSILVEVLARLLALPSGGKGIWQVGAAGGRARSGFLRSQ